MNEDELKMAISIAFFTCDNATLKRIALLSIPPVPPTIMLDCAIDVLSCKLSTREYNDLLSQIQFESIMA